MTHRATGTFDITLNPQSQDDASSGVGRMTIDKRFQGDLVATSTGQMLTFGTAVPDSAGYVAMERVRGTLQGRTGSFALQHSGTSARGKLQLSVTVVPDSGTDDLAGLAGRMTIDADDGNHDYTLEYTLDPAA